MRDRSGFSVIELLIGAGLAVGVTVILAQLTTTAQKGSIAVSGFRSTQEWESLVRKAIENPATCTASIQPCGTDFGSCAIRIKASAGAGAADLAAAGQPVSGFPLEIVTIDLRNTSVKGTEGSVESMRGTLHIESKQTHSSLSQAQRAKIQSTDIPILLTKTEGATHWSCGSNGEISGAAWKQVFCATMNADFDPATERCDVSNRACTATGYAPPPVGQSACVRSPAETCPVGAFNGELSSILRPTCPATAARPSCGAYAAPVSVSPGSPLSVACRCWNGLPFEADGTCLSCMGTATYANQTLGTGQIYQTFGGPNFCEITLSGAIRLVGGVKLQARKVTVNAKIDGVGGGFYGGAGGGGGAGGNQNGWAPAYNTGFGWGGTGNGSLGGAGGAGASVAGTAAKPSRTLHTMGSGGGGGGGGIGAANAGAWEGAGGGGGGGGGAGGAALTIEAQQILGTGTIDVRGEGNGGNGANGQVQSGPNKNWYGGNGGAGGGSGTYLAHQAANRRGQPGVGVNAYPGHTGPGGNGAWGGAGGHGTVYFSVPNNLTVVGRCATATCAGEPAGVLVHEP